MWRSALSVVVCPGCRSSLRIETHDAATPTASPGGPEPPSARPSDAEDWVECGGLYCQGCNWVYPIVAGVPVMLTYETSSARRAFAAWPSGARRDAQAKGFQLPTSTPPRGERSVGASFSTEWADYDYGPTLWTAPTEDRLRTFRGECGLGDGELRGRRFLEIGCGLGILTDAAASRLGAEAWGMDLSSAVFRAASHFKSSRRLHFVQASVFAPPFKFGEFDYVYSHGVLHHTRSTEEAVKEASRLVGPGGRMYVWLYGHDDVRVSLARRLAYAVEAVVRPVLARLPSFLATPILWPTVPLYQIASLLGRRAGTHAAVYTWKQALHAARDRFSPLYAHRHEYEEVAAWFRDLGFTVIERVKGHEVAPSWALAIERNVAIRAARP